MMTRFSRHWRTRAGRKLLDRLRQKNGQTLGDLCDGLNMSRQAVAKHLALLRKANLVSWKRDGREIHHFINPVPINELAERWIRKFEHPGFRPFQNRRGMWKKGNREPIS
jgi:DNA-binding transcriptional ArsR family regulator